MQATLRALIVFGAVGLALLATDASPQGLIAPPAAAATDPVEPAAPAAARVPAGTIVDLEIVDALSTRRLKRGDTFALRLAAPIMFDGRVVVAAGAPGAGQIIDSGPAGALGKPAKLLLAARYLEVEGGRIGLHGMVVSQSGVDHSDAVMVASMVPYVGILAAFAHGGEIELPAGMKARAKLAADLPVPGLSTGASAPTK